MFVVFVLLLIPVVSAAQGLPKQIVPEECNTQPGGCQSICDIAKLAQNVLNYGIFLAVIISAFLFAFAGWKLLTAGGNTEVYAQGKKIFLNVAIGLVMILGGWLVVDLLMNTLTGGKGIQWNRVCAEILSHFQHMYA